MVDDPVPIAWSQTAGEPEKDIDSQLRELISVPLL